MSKIKLINLKSKFDNYVYFQFEQMSCLVFHYFLYTITILSLKQKSLAFDFSLLGKQRRHKTKNLNQAAC